MFNINQSISNIVSPHLRRVDWNLTATGILTFSFCLSSLEESGLKSRFFILLSKGHGVSPHLRRVDWNFKGFAKVEKIMGLSSLEESGLKYCLKVGPVHKGVSLLTWGEWIEIPRYIHLQQAKSVSPHLRRVDWNLIHPGQSRKTWVSPHLRRVDWNQSRRVPGQCPGKSLLTWGEWIEMNQFSSYCY